MGCAVGHKDTTKRIIRMRILPRMIINCHFLFFLTRSTLHRYLFFWDKFEKANFALQAVIDTREKAVTSRTVTHILNDMVNDGGQWDMIVNLVHKYGVVPKQVYGESFHSSSSGRLNSLLRTKLRGYAVKLRNASDDGKSEKDLVALKDKFMEEVYRLMCITLGPPPSKFSWSAPDESKKKDCTTTDNINEKEDEEETVLPLVVEDITPRDFWTKYVKFPIDDYVCLVNATTKDKPFNRLLTVKYLGNVVGGTINILFVVSLLRLSLVHPRAPSS